VFWGSKGGGRKRGRVRPPQGEGKSEKEGMISKKDGNENPQDWKGTERNQEGIWRGCSFWWYSEKEKEKRVGEKKYATYIH